MKFRTQHSSILEHFGQFRHSELFLSRQGSQFDFDFFYLTKYKLLVTIGQRFNTC